MKIAIPAFDKKIPTRIKPNNFNKDFCSSGKPINTIKSCSRPSVNEFGEMTIATYGPINPNPAKSRNDEPIKRIINQGIFLRSSSSRNKISLRYCGKL